MGLSGKSEENGQGLTLAYYGQIDCWPATIGSRIIKFIGCKNAVLYTLLMDFS